jgi:hypothetical protein
MYELGTLSLTRPLERGVRRQALAAATRLFIRVTTWELTRGEVLQLCFGEV